MRLAGNGQPPAPPPYLLRCRTLWKGVIKARTTIAALYLGTTRSMNGCLRMTLPPVAPELAARLANYNIDDRARAILQELAPVLESNLGAAVDEVIAGAAR